MTDVDGKHLMSVPFGYPDLGSCLSFQTTDPRFRECVISFKIWLVVRDTQHLLFDVTPFKDGTWRYGPDPDRLTPDDLFNAAKISAHLAVNDGKRASAEMALVSSKAGPHKDDFVGALSVLRRTAAITSVVQEMTGWSRYLSEEDAVLAWRLAAVKEVQES